MPNNAYDTVVIGGGHNGLVAAAYLGRAGRRVLLVERRPILGGGAATESVFEGFRFETGAHDSSMFRPEILRELDLRVPTVRPPISVVSVLAGGKTLPLWRDIDAAAQSISKYSSVDAERYRAFAEQVRRQSAVLELMIGRVPPSLPFNGAGRTIRALSSWAGVALAARRLGRRGMMDFIRTIPLEVSTLLDNWFESAELKGAIASHAIGGTMQGPRGSGTSMMLLYHCIGGFPRGATFIKGGIGMLSHALQGAAEKFGVEIRTGVEVERILTDDYAAVGVRLTDGSEIRAQSVASSADPRHTLLDLVGAPRLEVRVVRQLRNVRYRGSTAKVNLALSGLPHFDGISDAAELAGHIIVSPSMDYLERAYDDAKYGRISAAPHLEIVIPTLHDRSGDQHVMSITVRYTPYRLSDGDWVAKREELGELVLSTLTQYAPDLPQRILHRQVLTPLDYEREYGMTEGSIYHGQMGLDQLLFMRPIPGYGSYRTPVDRLYFCGAGAHPGGGVTGAPGRNAARVIDRELR